MWESTKRGDVAVHGVLVHLYKENNLIQDVKFCRGPHMEEGTIVRGAGNC
jgi:hypothetical protein